LASKLAAVFEKFDGEHADVLQGFENAAGGVFRGALDGGLEARGGGEREAGGCRCGGGFPRAGKWRFAIARADRKDGEFASEGTKRSRISFTGR